MRMYRDKSRARYCVEWYSYDPVYPGIPGKTNRRFFTGRGSKKKAEDFLAELEEGTLSGSPIT